NTSKFDSGLFEVSRAVGSVAARGWGLNAIATQAASSEVAALVASKQARFTGNSVQVYVEWTSASARDLAALRAAGAVIEVEDTQRGITQATVPLPALEQIEALPLVKRMRLPDYPIHAAGSQTAQGDELLRLSNLRDIAGVDGTGITIGVISDGIAGLQ